MDIIDNSINRRLLSGYFATKQLFAESATENQSHERSITIAADTLASLRLGIDFSPLLISNAYDLIKEMEMIDFSHLLESPSLLNSLINTMIPNDYFAIDEELLLRSCQLYPAVTAIDKILWFNAYAAETGYTLSLDDEKDEVVDAINTWVCLLRLFQEKEMQFQKTINVNLALKKNVNILELLGKNWNTRFNRYLIPLSKEEKLRLSNLKSERETILSQFEIKRKQAFSIALKTDRQWGLFLQIINDLAKNEFDVISEIMKPISSKKKLNTIYNYQSIIRGIENGHYFLNGEKIELSEVYDVVTVRFCKAQNYCRAHLDSGKSFVVNPVILDLAQTPNTVNYLYILFHQFRLSPKKETAIQFLSVALQCTRRNFRLKNEQKNHSINDIIEEFYNTVTAFYSNHEAIINKMSFGRIQNDSALVNENLYSLETISFLESELAEFVNTALDNIESSNQKYHRMRKRTSNQLIKEIDDAKNTCNQLDQMAESRQIVVSLNIIYMFSEVLRIILTNPRIHINLRNPEIVKMQRYKLRQIDSALVQCVYSNLDPREMGMLEYRERIGIESQILSEQEALVDQYINQQFSEVLKSRLEQLIDSIETQDISQLIETKRQIRQEILAFPACDEKEHFAAWLDQISDRIGTVLVEKCKDNVNEFTQAIEKITSGLGQNSEKLPRSAIESLATAEILFHKYVTADYAKSGFDYSSISALYYQAFENAYNALIWYGYAEKLNTLEIKGKKFTEIMDDSKNRAIQIPEAKGYLDPDPKNRKYYIEYSTNKQPSARIMPRCMYKSFAIIMKNIIKNSKLPKLCDYFAGITGFTCSAEMFNNDDFMYKCKTFAEMVDNSTENRNNASHGGTKISMSQCKDDKRTVINEVEAVRHNSVGLIQQLLYLIPSNTQNSEN